MAPSGFPRRTGGRPETRRGKPGGRGTRRTPPLGDRRPGLQGNRRKTGTSPCIVTNRPKVAPFPDEGAAPNAGAGGQPPTRARWATRNDLVSRCAATRCCSPEEAATVLRLGRTTVYALMKAGELHAVHIGRSCRISRAELERYVRRLETPLPSAAPHPSRRRHTPTNQGGLFDFAAESVDRR